MPNESRAFDPQRFTRYTRSHELGGYGELRYLAQTVSTNADAARILPEADSAGSTILTDLQTGGVGRRGTDWQSERGTGLLFTTILLRPIAARRLWTVPIWAGICVAEALVRAFPQLSIAPYLKYPNDVLFGTRKVGGLLGTSTISGEIARAAIGVGINVLAAPALAAYATDSVGLPPIALRELTALDDDAREALLAWILESFARESDLLEDSATDRLVTRWAEWARLERVRYSIVFEGKTRNDAQPLRLRKGGKLTLRDARGEFEIDDRARVRVVT